MNDDDAHYNQEASDRLDFTSDYRREYAGRPWDWWMIGVLVALVVLIMGLAGAVAYFVTH